MENLFGLLKRFTGFLSGNFHILPEMFVVLFTLINAIIVAFDDGFKAGFIMFVKQIFAAEYIIHQNVTMAINGDPAYGFLAFMAILNGVFVIYVLTKFIYKYILVGITGATAPVSGFFISILIVGVLEMAAIGWLEHVFFIPLWDGIIYLALNLKPVFTNINWFHWARAETIEFGENMSVNATSLPSSEQTPVAP